LEHGRDIGSCGRSAWQRDSFEAPNRRGCTFTQACDQTSQLNRNKIGNLRAKHDSLIIDFNIADRKTLL
jgi:hypothetical protein